MDNKDFDACMDELRKIRESLNKIRESLNKVSKSLPSHEFIIFWLLVFPVISILIWSIVF